MDDAAGRRLLGRAPPALDADLALVAEIGLDVMNVAEFAGLDDPFDLLDCRSVSVVMTDSKR